MKKLFLSFFVTVIGFASFAHAQAPCSTVEECETLRADLIKAEFNRQERSKINKRINKQLSILSKYWPQKDSVVNGVRWSIVLKGKHKNRGLDSAVVNGIIQQSPATEECKLIGGRLPRKDEFIDLKDHWDDESVVPAKFKAKMNNKTFWSPTAMSYLDVDAYYFNGSVGATGIDTRVSEKSVRCIFGLNPFVQTN